MKLSFRLLIPCLLAGSSLLLLSGCGEFEERQGGREYNRHAYGGSYRADRDYDDGYQGGRRYETVERHDYDRDRSNRYDRDRDYDRHERNYVDSSRTVVVAPRDPSTYGTRSGGSHSRSYGSSNSGATYSSRAQSHSGGSYSRTNAAVVAPASRGSHSGSHHAAPATRPGTRSTTNVAVNASTPNRQGGSKDKDKDKDKDKGKDKKKH